MGGAGSKRKEEPKYAAVAGDTPRPQRPALPPPAQEHSINQRYRAPAMLLFACCCLVLGFFLITVIGFVDYKTQRGNQLLRVDYPSGNGYWPSTVSEMVHNHDSVGGKLFYTFGMISGICIFYSFYPFNLRNVYTGNEMVPGTTIYWTTFRQICPSMGLWLLIGVNTYPTVIAIESRGHTKMFCVFLHLAGAGMLFVGYMLCELKCLGMLGFSRSRVLRIEERERKIRNTLAWIITVGFGCFCALQSLLVLGKKLDICCADKWATKGDEITDSDGEVHRVSGGPQVVDTATHTMFWLKVASFVFEDMAGCAMVGSHLAIWYFCEERHLNYGEISIKEVHDQDDTNQVDPPSAEPTPETADPLSDEPTPFGLGEGENRVSCHYS